MSLRQLNIHVDFCLPLIKKVQYTAYKPYRVTTTINTGHNLSALPHRPFILQHKGDVVVGHAVAEVGRAVFSALEHRVEGVAVPVQVAHVHGGGGVVVTYSPHFYCEDMVEAN